MFGFPKAPKKSGKHRVGSSHSTKKKSKGSSSRPAKSGGHQRGHHGQGGGDGDGRDGGEGGSRGGRSRRTATDTAPTPMLKIYCSFYTQPGHDLQWALSAYSQQKTEWYINQAVKNDNQQFIRDSRTANPLNSTKHIRTILLFHLKDSGANRTMFKNLGATLSVPGEEAEWSCQDYVMELLELLHEMKYITEEIWQCARDIILLNGRAEDDDDDADEEEAEMEMQQVFKSDEFEHDSNSSGGDAAGGEQET